MSTPGLVDVTTADLEKLLRALHRQEIECPLTPAGLAGTGLQDASHVLLGHLRHLDTPAVRAAVVAVLAERPHKR